MQIALGPQIVRVAFPMPARHPPWLRHLDHVPEFMRHRIAPTFIGEPAGPDIQVTAIRITARPEAAIPRHEVHLVAWGGGRIEFPEGLVVTQLAAEDLIALLAHPQRAPCMGERESGVRRIPPHAHMFALEAAGVRRGERGEEVGARIQRGCGAGDVADLHVVDGKSAGARHQRSDAHIAQGILPENFEPHLEPVGVKGAVVDDARRGDHKLTGGGKAIPCGRAKLDLHIAEIRRGHFQADLQVVVEAEIEIRTADQRGQTHGRIRGRRSVFADE